MRIQPVDRTTAPPEVAAILDGATTLLGRTPRSFSVMANTPMVARWMLAFVASIHRQGAGSILDGATKNLAVLKVATLMGSFYSAGHNKEYGREFGMTDEKYDALQADYMTSDLLDAREKAVLAWAEAVTANTARDNDEAFERLKAHFSDEEITELTLVICHFNGINRFTGSLKLELESSGEVGRIRSTRDLPIETVETYVRSVCDAREAAVTGAAGR
jgi:alkylhydroperoxidase family enzyme